MLRRVDLAAHRARQRAQAGGFGFGFGVGGRGGGAPVFNPGTLSLTAWLRDYSGSAPWSGTASAGVSGDGSHDAVAGTAPAAGTALNGHGSADFNGSTHGLTWEGTLDSYVNALSLSGWLLVSPDDVSSGRLLSDANSDFEVIVYGGGAYLVLESGSVGPGRAISAATWSLITFRYNGTNAQIGINEAPGASGGGSSASFSTSLSPLSGAFALGSNTVPGAFYDGLIAEVGITDTVLTDQNFADIKSYINARYGLSL